MIGELKQCPCCGGKAVLYVKDGVRVICKDCNLQTITLVDYNSVDKPCGGAIERVIERWNKRIKTE